MQKRESYNVKRLTKKRAQIGRAKKISGDRSAQCFDSGRQSRHFPRRRVFMVNAFCDATHQFRLSGPKRCCCNLFVTRCDRFFNFTQVCPNPRTAGLIDGKAGLVLTGAFFGLGRIRHGCFPFVGLRSNFLRKSPTPGFKTGTVWPKRASRACAAASRDSGGNWKPFGRKYLPVAELRFALFLKGSHPF